MVSSIIPTQIDLLRLRRHRTLDYEFGSAPRATWKMNLVVPEFNTGFESRLNHKWDQFGIRLPMRHNRMTWNELNWRSSSHSYETLLPVPWSTMSGTISALMSLTGRAIIVTGTTVSTSHIQNLFSPRVMHRYSWQFYNNNKGGAQGIGLTFAKACIEAGAVVAVTDIIPQPDQEFVSYQAQVPDRLHYYP